MQDSPVQRSSAPQPSALLQCLSQLNADTWAQVLLPKLLKVRSAANVALACRELRDLCFSSRQNVNLGALLDSSEPSSLKAVVSGLPMHFTNCSAVSLKLESDKSYHTMPYLLPALARLPRLDGLSLTLDGDLQPLLACTMLYSIRMQLSGLRSLTIKTTEAEEWAEADDIHAELGGITQLTRLCLDLDEVFVRSWYDSADFIRYKALRQLSSLQQLQHLVIWARWTDPIEVYYDRHNRHLGAAPAQAFAAMTSLTRLEFNPCSLDTLDCFSSCRNLQHLAICMTQNSLLPADWASIAALTQLTQLRLLNAFLSEASTEACGALSKLARLQVVAAAGWSQDFLPALTACVQLTEISGDWTWTGSNAEHFLTQVLVLEGLVMPSNSDVSAQMGVFPRLRHLRTDVLVNGTQDFLNSMHTSSLVHLCRHCTGLQELVLPANGSFVDADAVDYVAGIQSMKVLQQLTCLKFTVKSNLELLALIRTCCVLESYSLQDLYVSQRRQFAGPPCTTAAAWMHLGQLCRLRHLAVRISDVQMHGALAADATAFMTALSGCGTVHLTLPMATFAPFETALAELRRVGWAVPRVVFKWKSGAC